MDKLTNRFWEIDALRGIALLLMVVFHVVYILVYFFDQPISVQDGGWFWVGRIAGSLFVFLVGLSASVKFLRLKKQEVSEKVIQSSFVKRGLQILGWGMVITAVSYVLLPGEYIVFGVLHLIGVSVMLIYYLLRKPGWLLPLGILLNIVGWSLRWMVRVEFPWLLWLGFISNNWSTLDYYPLLPWFGVVILGAWTGNRLYWDYERRFQLPELGQVPGFKMLAWLGRHTLVIYLIHVPIILAALAVLLGLFKS